MNRETRKYIGYAFGEILLVIVGILIALQIDNWNSDRQDKARFDGYLASIARNMQDDIDQLENLRAARSGALFLARRARNELLFRPSYGVDQIEFLAAAMRAARTTLYFNANTSGFDSLKNSGVLDELQGKDIEELLSRYYIGVERVRQLENDFNTRILSALAIPTHIDGRPAENFAVSNPAALWPGRVEELQPYYQAYFRSPAPRSLLEAASQSSAILRDYEQLLALAQLFVDIVDAGGYAFDDHARHLLAELDALEQGVGYADVVTDGALPLGYYKSNFGFAYYDGDTPTPRRLYVDVNSMRTVGESLTFDYKGGAAWAVFYIEAMPTSDSIGRASRDYSRYDTLILEAKGANGGERLLLNMKDADDPDDGSQTNIEIVLEDDWKTWEIALSDFETADLSRLNTVLNFLMIDEQEPVSFSVRTVAFR